MLSSETLTFCKPFFTNRRCLLQTSLTILRKLMSNVSEKLFNYLQIPGHLLHLISIIIDIISLRQVDNKRFNFIIKYLVHDTKFFLFFNPNFKWIYFLYGLSPQLLMAYLQRHSSDARAISMGFNMQRYGDNCRTLQAAFSTIELMTYCFSFNNTDFSRNGFGIEYCVLT